MNTIDSRADRVPVSRRIIISCKKGVIVMGKVGFIGLGIMGRPMAKNLLKAGVELLVSDLNKEAVADVVAAGGVEASYAEIGAQCDRVILMVPSGEISKAILFAEDGVASTIKAGSVVCDMSSVTPVESQECYQQLKEKGITMLYISHKLDEVMELSDRFTVLRDGQHIATMVTGESTVTDMITGNISASDASTAAARTGRKRKTGAS